MERDVVVFTYTDAQAAEDGVLVDVSGLAPFPINRATAAVWETLTRPVGRLPGALGGSPVTDTTRFSRLADELGRRIKAGELQDGMLVMEWEGHKIWAMPNETIYRPVAPYNVPGWTIMFPEDY